MDDPLQKSLSSLHQSITKRSPKSAVTASNDKEDKLFKAQTPDLSPRDQQDLMSLPFFSLEKSKRTRPIEYEQGNVKVFIEGRPSVGIATIWDADLLDWVRRWYCYHPLPAEPDAHVTAYPAQAIDVPQEAIGDCGFGDGSCDGLTAD